MGLHVDSDEEDADVDVSKNKPDFSQNLRVSKTTNLLIIKLDEQIEDLFKSKRSTKDKSAGDKPPAAAATAAGVAVTSGPGTPANVAAIASNLLSTAAQSTAQSVAEKLKVAKGIADK